MNPLRVWWQIMRHGLPAAVRREWVCVLLSAALLLAGGVFGGVATALDPDLAVVFLPAEHLTESPSARVAELEALEASGGQVDAAGHTAFSAFLASNNIRVTVLAFALGLTFGIGTAVVLFFNGALIGCIVYRYVADGVGVFLVAWIGPHGSIEVPCIILGGAAGLVIARAQWQALANLRSTGATLLARTGPLRHSLVHLVVGAATLLFPAALVEGGFSQINAPTFPYALKIAAAAVLFAALCAYLFLLPVGGAGASRRDQA